MKSITTFIAMLLAIAAAAEKPTPLDFVPKGRNAPTHSSRFGSGYYFIAQEELGKSGRIVFDVDYGDVIVRGTDKKEASLEAVFVADTPIQLTGEEYLRQFEFTLRKIEDGVRITARLRATTAPPAELHVIVDCWKKAAVSISTNHGDVEVSNMEDGRVEVLIGTGNLTATRIASVMTATVQEGDLDLSLVPQEGVRYAFETRRGNITVSVPQAVGASFETTVREGSVRMGLPLSALERPGGTTEWRAGISKSYVLLKTGVGTITVRGL